MTTMHVEPRLLTPEEIGRVVRAFRTEFGWSQETLAELSGLTPRTIQRLEAGQPSSLDTRRAVGRAFRFEDIDWLSKPLAVPTQEQLRARREAFEREHLVLAAEPVDGRKLAAMLVDGAGFGAIGPGSLGELPRSAQDAFAAILDYLRDCLDIADVASRTEMLGYGDIIDEMAAPLREAGFRLCAAVRRTEVTGKDWADKTPIPLAVTYVVAAPADQLQRQLVVPRKLSGGW